MSRRIISRQFTFQLILIFVIFTLATVGAVGIPVMIILNRQVEMQMGALIGQAKQTTSALIENKQNQLGRLATLITERPTLNQLLLDEKDSEEFDQYLTEFANSANVSLVALCYQNELKGSSGENIPSNLCEANRQGNFDIFEPMVWLLIESQFNSLDLPGYRVIVGERIETIFFDFKQQSGLDYALYLDRDLVFISQDHLHEYLIQRHPKDFFKDLLLTQKNNRPQTSKYLAGQIPLNEQEEYTLIGILDIEPYQILQSDLRRIVVIMLFSVCLAGVVIAILVSRQISQPITRLASSAVDLRSGELGKSISARSKVWEIDQLTNTLEDARVSLKYSLDQIHKEKAWMENLMNSVIEGLVTIDKFNRITYVSKATERILGLRREQIVDHLLDDIFETPDGEMLFSQQLPATSQNNRISVVVKDRDILLSVSASNLIPPDAGQGTLALVIRDVTDEERMHRLLGDFLANITHEFRTPLSALSASVELLLNQVHGLSLSEIEQLLYALNIGILDLQSLIDNLIEASSIEAGRFKVNPKSTLLDEIIADAVNSIAPIAKRRGLELNVINNGQSIFVKADKRRTCQALVNLLSNAIKHSPEAGIVTITSEVVNNVVKVEVHDQGQGVPHLQRGNLFNRFITSDGKGDYDQPGLGLGLSVVKAIIEGQGGSVGYEDGKIAGTVFWFT